MALIPGTNYDVFVTTGQTINFGVTNAKGEGFSVGQAIPLNTWTQVLGSYNAKTGDILLWINHEKVAAAKKAQPPFVDLDPAYTPGVSIGNVQNNHGPHNQPINGVIADLRMYDQALEPDVVDTANPMWENPPLR